MPGTDASATDSGSSDSGALEKLQSMLVSMTEGARAVKDAGQQKVADRRDQRERDALLRELGELYYEAHSAGRDHPPTVARNRLIAQLDELERRSRSGPDAEAEEKGSSDAGS